MFQQINDTANFIKTQASITPEIGIILGTGLGGLVNEIEITDIIPYDSIPGFPVSTVEGHSGQMIFGRLSGRNVVAMKGRFHYYEGYTPQQVILPVRVMAQLGIKYLFVSNASGGVNPDFEIGDLMVITDHINLIPNPLIGRHQPEFGVRFPDMSNVYHPGMIAEAGKIAAEMGIALQYGVYTATTGPTYETPAEYKHFRIIGADAVGMSTAPEVITARQMGIPCFAMSIITDLGVPGKIVEITHEEVQKVAAGAEKKMTRIFKELICRLS
ncbi:MAG: purine-nucleoside phosphorylase [Bacteroidales bacterium]|nr:purine-nucleoside phosphorylase [Bacteroidales bacterium]HQL70189.1 purine-nucleoside phosphorylase [Bacteroidales bacterium]